MPTPQEESLPLDPGRTPPPSEVIPPDPGLGADAEPPEPGEVGFHAGPLSQYSFSLPPGVQTPLRQDELGQALFFERCRALGEIELNGDAVHTLAKRYEPVVRAHYLAAYLEAGEADRFDVRVRAASTSEEGLTTLLVTFEDTDTGNFVLPRRTSVSSPEGKSWTCEVEGGSSFFQGILLTHVGRRQLDDDKVTIRFRESYLCPSFLVSAELARLSWGDWRSPFSSEFEDVLSGYGHSLKEVVRVKTAADPMFSPTFMRYLLATDDSVFFIGLGDMNGVGVVRTEFGFQFKRPLVGVLQIAPRPNGKSESIVSVISDISEADGDVALESTESQDQYHLSNLVQLLKEELQHRVGKGLWKDDWKLDVHEPRVTPSGAIRLAVSIEDSNGRYQLPWLGEQAVGRVLESESFIGIGVEMKLPESLLPSIAETVSDSDQEPSGAVDINISHAYLTQQLMDNEVSRLSHRQVTPLPKGADAEIIVAESPSDLARSSVLFPELQRAIGKDLIGMGSVAPAQLAALRLKNILVGHDRKVPVAGIVDVDYYLVHVEHQWGTHIVRFSRIDELGCVPFKDATTIVGFFPRELNCCRDLSGGGEDEEATV